jgi:hypothetical protein
MVRAVYKFHFKLVKKMHVTNGDTWKESYALTETDVFDRTHMFSDDSRLQSVEGLYPRYADQLHSLE